LPSFGREKSPLAYFVKDRNQLTSPDFSYSSQSSQGQAPRTVAGVFRSLADRVIHNG
jgi:hypothetical protein